MTAALGVISALGVMFLFSMHRAWEKMLRMDCKWDLTQLGEACREYAAKHNGQFPSAWSDLDFTGDMANWAKTLRCPQTHHETGAWTNVDLWADYRLLPGRTTNDPPNRVLAIEPLANHNSAGANVLFVDGRTEWWPLSGVLGQTK